MGRLWRDVLRANQTARVRPTGRREVFGGFVRLPWPVIFTVGTDK